MDYLSLLNEIGFRPCKTKGPMGRMRREYWHLTGRSALAAMALRAHDGLGLSTSCMALARIVESQNRLIIQSAGCEARAP